MCCNRATTIIWLLAIALFALHQDVWFWSDGTLVFGFMPVGLLYHASYSLVAAALWAGAVKFAWPRGLEAWAESSPDSNAEQISRRHGDTEGAEKEHDY